MRYPCSETYLIEQLKLAFQRESGTAAAQFDEALMWWKQTCGITLSGTMKQEAVEPVQISRLKEKEKLPKQIFHRLPENEAEMGIQDLQCSARVDYRAHDDSHIRLRVTGYFVGEPRDEAIDIYIMVYNGNQELIGFYMDGFTCDYEGEENPFDESFVLPCDEWIGAVEVRFVPEIQLF